MERGAKLYRALSQAQMEEEQMVHHDYPEDHMSEEHDLNDAQYYNYPLQEWEEEGEEEEVIQEPSPGHVITASGEQEQGEDYTVEGYDFRNEREIKYSRFLEHCNMGESVLMEGEEHVEDSGEGPSHEEEMHDPNRETLYQMYAAPTGRRQATIYQCPVCNVMLKHPSKIEAHMRTHTGERPFQCDICGRAFTQRTPWRMHVKRHNQDLPFACSYGCGKMFPNASQRNAHDLRHTGNQRAGKPRPHLKPPKKYTCDMETEYDIALQQARMDIERGPPVIDVPLFEVDAPLPPPLSAAQHKRIDEVINAVAENRPVRPISTRVSDPSGNSSSRRTRSIRAPPIVAQCHHCGLMLKHPSKIQAHMRSHTGYKPFKCDKCGLSVATHYALKMHFLRKHVAGERPLACQWECGLRFVNESAKNEHERIVHKGIKRYFCSVGECCRFFSRRTHLISHRLRDHPGIIHVDEFEDAIDIDFADLHDMEGEVDERRDGLEVLRGRVIEGEIIDEEVMGGRRVQKQEHVLDIHYEDDAGPSRSNQVERVKLIGDESIHSTPSPLSTPSSIPFNRLIIPSDHPSDLPMPVPRMVVPRMTNMKIPRIVRPRGNAVL